MNTVEKNEFDGGDELPDLAGTSVERLSTGNSADGRLDV